MHHILHFYDFFYYYFGTYVRIPSALIIYVALVWMLFFFALYKMLLLNSRQVGSALSEYISAINFIEFFWEKFNIFFFFIFVTQFYVAPHNFSVCMWMILFCFRRKSNQRFIIVSHQSFWFNKNKTPYSWIDNAFLWYTFIGRIYRHTLEMI